MIIHSAQFQGEYRFTYFVFIDDRIDLWVNFHYFGIPKKAQCAHSLIKIPFVWTDARQHR